MYLLKSKRGVKFQWTALAAYGAFILFMLLIFAFNKIEYKNGVDQLHAIESFYSGEAFLQYLDRALDLSMQSATKRIADGGGIYQTENELGGTASSCGTWRGSPLWTIGTQDCYPADKASVSEATYKELVADNLNYYLFLYPDATLYVKPSDLILEPASNGITIRSSPNIDKVEFQLKRGTSNEERDIPDDFKKKFTFWPVEGPVTDCFGGPRKVQGANPWHQGIDFSVSAGNDVRTIADGKVFSICVFGEGGATCGGYGNEIVIKHEDDLYSHYAHLSKFLVAKGEKVKSGQVIAYSGNTGFSTGPHLHFSIFTNDWRNNYGDYKNSNPFHYLPRTYNGFSTNCPLDTYGDP